MAKQLELFPEEKSKMRDSSNKNELKPILDAEWCFQFFDNKPMVFAYQEEGQSPKPLVLQIQPSEGEGLHFHQNGMQFKIFARPISEETKLEREKTKENASQNKEAEA